MTCLVSDFVLCTRPRAMPCSIVSWMPCSDSCSREPLQQVNKWHEISTASSRNHPIHSYHVMSDNCNNASWLCYVFATATKGPCRAEVSWSSGRQTSDMRFQDLATLSRAQRHNIHTQRTHRFIRVYANHTVLECRQSRSLSYTSQMICHELLSAVHCLTTAAQQHSL